MKKQFRILAAALALCLSLLCCPAAFAAVDSSSCQTVPYAQATSQPLGQPITITGTPNYSAAKIVSPIGQAPFSKALCFCTFTLPQGIFRCH